MTKVIATHPRAVVLALIAAGLLLGLVAGNAMLSPRASADGHISGVESIVVEDVIVDHKRDIGSGNKMVPAGEGRDSSTQVRIWGSGFAPGQEVVLLVNDGPGTPSDISNFLTNTSANNTLVANDQGAWTTVWTLGRFTRSRSGIGPGDGDVERVRTLSVIDPGTFDVIATTPLSFCRPSERQTIMNDIAEMESELASDQADFDRGLPEKPVNVSQDVWDRLAVPVLQDELDKLGESIVAQTAAIEAEKAKLGVPATCPA